MNRTLSASLSGIFPEADRTALFDPRHHPSVESARVSLGFVRLVRLHDFCGWAGLLCLVGSMENRQSLAACSARTMTQLAKGDSTPSIKSNT
jgi:hypothetical protein